MCMCNVSLSHIVPIVRLGALAGMPYICASLSFVYLVCGDNSLLPYYDELKAEKHRAKAGAGGADNLRSCPHSSMTKNRKSTSK